MLVSLTRSVLDGMTCMLSIFAMTIVGAACTTAGVVVFMSGAHWFQPVLLFHNVVKCLLHNCIEVVAPLISFIYVLGL